MRFSVCGCRRLLRQKGSGSESPREREKERNTTGYVGGWTAQPDTLYTPVARREGGGLISSSFATPLP